MSERPPLFSEREKGKIMAFKHVLNTIAEYEPRVDAGVKWVSEDQETKKQTHVFNINERLLGVMDRIGYRMYQDFEPVPHMKEVADALLTTHQERKAERNKVSLAPVVAIWEASDE